MMSTTIKITESNIPNPARLVSWFIDKFGYVKAKTLLAKQYGVKLGLQVNY